MQSTRPLPEEKNPQVLYQNRWVELKNFRVFIYSETETKLVNSYDEYKQALETGKWFATKEEIEVKRNVSEPSNDNTPISINQSKRGRKPKHGTNG